MPLRGPVGHTPAHVADGAAAARRGIWTLSLSPGSIHGLQ
jgi:hypothetical protein